MTIEVCSSSILSIKNAFEAGVDRIELCSALEVGGLTPSAGLIKEAVGLKLLPIHCLIRPRQGHFFYSSYEINIIEKNIEYAAEAGCHGVVVGIHNSNFKLDLTLLKKWKSLAGSMNITFHRAFDVLVNPMDALSQLIDLGYDCVLTSGREEKAIDGIENLKYWNSHFGSKICIMPGSGIGVYNCIKFKDAGFSSIHLSGAREEVNLSIPNGVNKKISFLDQSIKVSNLETLAKVVQLVKSS